MQPIIVPAIDAAVPSPVHEHAAAIASQVARLEKSRGELDSTVESLKQSPLDTAGVFAGENELRETAFDGLAVELRIRRDIESLIAEHHDALAALRREAFEAFEAAKSSIEGKLVKLGWQPATPGSLHPHRVLPVFILSHPAVRAARERADELTERMADRSARQANAAAIAAIEGKIKAARARLAAV